MDELEVVNKLGAVTSTEVAEILHKHQANVILQLQSLEKVGEIKMIITTKLKGKRRIYTTNDIYKNMFNNEE